MTDFQVVEVAWEDAFADNNWVPTDEQDEPYIVHSIGYLVFKNKHKLVLVQNVSPQDHVSHRITILQANVRKITKLYPVER